MAQAFTITLTDEQWTYAQELATQKDDAGADSTPTVAQWETWFSTQLWAEVKKRGAASAVLTGSTAEITETDTMTANLTSLGVG